MPLLIEFDIRVVTLHFCVYIYYSLHEFILQYKQDCEHCFCFVIPSLICCLRSKYL
jgi:hypothetical protein